MILPPSRPAQPGNPRLLFLPALLKIPAARGGGGVWRPGGPLPARTPNIRRGRGAKGPRPRLGGASRPAAAPPGTLGFFITAASKALTLLGDEHSQPPPGRDADSSATHQIGEGNHQAFLFQQGVDPVVGQQEEFPLA